MLQAKDPFPFPSEVKYDNLESLSFSGQGAITTVNYDYCRYCKISG